MSLWGNSDNVTSRGTVTLDYSTKIVTGNAGGSGTQFGAVGSAKTGDVIRFGFVGSGGTYFGDAVIKSIASTTSLTIASTTGLSGAAIAATTFYVSQLPKYTVNNAKWSEKDDLESGDNLVYGINATASANTGTTGYEKTDAGWVGITTYLDNSGSLRVKRETLVAMSGITTGSQGIQYPTGIATNYGGQGGEW